MNSRERFRETMNYGKPDRIPLFEEGIRNEVFKTWQLQGLPQKADISKMFSYDGREEIEVNLYPYPGFIRRFTLYPGMEKLRLKPFPNHFCLPLGWSERIRKWENSNIVLMLPVHPGFFLTMGVNNWRKFKKVIYMLYENPELVHKTMRIQGEFAARLAERILKDTEIDAAIFSEPIGGIDRPLISPRMYEDFVLTSYRPVLDVLEKNGVKTIILRTYTDVRLFIPSLLKYGFNCLWACEINTKTMDYRDLRREFGRELRLIGGIDIETLRHNKEAIRREIEDKVLPLLADGGYIPLANGRIRKDVSFQNYLYYRKLLEKITKE